MKRKEICTHFSRRVAEIVIAMLIRIIWEIETGHAIDMNDRANHKMR